LISDLEMAEVVGGSLGVGLVIGVSRRDWKIRENGEKYFVNGFLVVGFDKVVGEVLEFLGGEDGFDVVFFCSEGHVEEEVVVGGLGVVPVGGAGGVAGSGAFGEVHVGGGAIAGERV
jgi:hypothetical protein